MAGLQFTSFHFFESEGGVGGYFCFDEQGKKTTVYLLAQLGFFQEHYSFKNK